MIAKEDEAARESLNERRFTEGMERAREMEETAEYAAGEVQFIRALDEQRENEKAIYGGGFILSEKAAAEKAAAKHWKLSERE